MEEAGLRMRERQDTFNGRCRRGSMGRQAQFVNPGARRI